MVKEKLTDEEYHTHLKAITARIKDKFTTVTCPRCKQGYTEYIQSIELYKEQGKAQRCIYVGCRELFYL
jgi:predicted nucleic-acid-binding Zn-ribbon protein